MSEQPNGKAPETETPPISRIAITFAGLDMATATISAENVTPAQFYAAAMAVDMVARELRAGQLAKAAMGSLVPAPDRLLELLRKGHNA